MSTTMKLKALEGQGEGIERDEKKGSKSSNGNSNNSSSGSSVVGMERGSRKELGSGTDIHGKESVIGLSPDEDEKVSMREENEELSEDDDRAIDRRELKAKQEAFVRRHERKKKKKQKKTNGRTRVTVTKGESLTKEYESFMNMDVKNVRIL